MDFEDFIINGKVILGESDIQKSKALIIMSNKNILGLKRLKIDNVTSSTVLSSSYESLRQILEAICLLKGYKVYSHEAYVYYLLKINEENISNKFNRLRKLRNGINYYAKDVSSKVSKDAFIEIQEICEYLKKKYLE
jgi:hypothetical protein